MIYADELTVQFDSRHETYVLSQLTLYSEQSTMPVC